MSQPVIVITAPRIVRDFMDKRSSSVSERPQLKMVDLVTNGHNMAFSGSGPVWRMQRKAIHTFLSRSACVRHIPIQEAEATQFMYELLEDSEVQDQTPGYNCILTQDRISLVTLRDNLRRS